MTVATDLLVAALASVLAWRQLAHARRRGVPTRWWPATFAAVALAAVLGAAWHAFSPRMDVVAADRLWAATMVAAGAIGCGLLASAVADECGPRVRRVVLAVAVAKYALFLGLAVPAAEYVGVVIDNGVSFAAVLAVHERAWWRRRSPRAAWVIGGVLVSLAAAGIQARHVALGGHLNHNDLYHLLQLPGLWLFHRGALAPTRRAA